MNSAPDARAALHRAFHAEHGRIVAALTRRFGAAKLDVVENAVQEATLRALERWPEEGIPTSTTGWLLRVAHNIAVDSIRRDQRLAPLPASHSEKGEEDPPAIDDELALMFLCCHPALPRSAQIALTLKMVCGFSALQIASAFLSDEATVSQRLLRAKQRLRSEKAEFELPAPDELPTRLEPILQVLYLVFNEGHTPSDGEEAVRRDLCDDALR
ncbi:MAG: sigma factor-like helix-turn-helix DNA-binding protein, partial [Polyangiaceae bacterium]